jgi:hypothetical protein
MLAHWESQVVEQMVYVGLAFKYRAFDDSLLEMSFS